jgi:4-diphosphocytidyl-2-C-methyl-D-erythritol kinase
MASGIKALVKPRFRKSLFKFILPLSLHNRQVLVYSNPSLGGWGNLSRSCVIHAPCKINVHLEVGERRNDGYHNLRSIFLCLEFGDLLEFRELGPPTEGFPLGEAGGNDLETVTGMGEDLPPERNIVTKAVSLFREKTGYAKPLSIKLEKRAPLGGGLGGGSSDGASALIALNALAEADLSREDLAVMAEKLGSDVPFFLAGGAALVEGRGERIRPLEGPRAPLWVVLVNPGFPAEPGRLLRNWMLFAKERRKAPVVLPVLFRTTS